MPFFSHAIKGPWEDGGDHGLAVSGWQANENIFAAENRQYSLLLSVSDTGVPSR